jgi:hypothetical protein
MNRHIAVELTCLFAGTKGFSDAAAGISSLNTVVVIAMEEEDP